MKLTKRLFTLLLFLAMGTTFLKAQVQMQPQQQQKIDVSDDELKSFTVALVDVQTINQEMQPKLITIVEDEGFEIQRFAQIQQAQQNPQTKVEVSEEEIEKFNKIAPELQKIQQEAQQEMILKITESGLTIERYQLIISAVQTDMEMQQKVEKLLEENETDN